MGVASTILSVAVPFIRNFDPNASNHQAFWDTIDRYGVAWACIGVFWLVVVLRVLYSPYEAWKEMKAKCDDEAKKAAECRMKLERSIQAQRDRVFQKTVNAITEKNRRPIGALQDALEPGITNEDVVWVCDELVRHKHPHPFINFIMPNSIAAEADWLEFLVEARSSGEQFWKNSDDLEFAIYRWSKGPGYDRNLRPPSPNPDK